MLVMIFLIAVNSEKLGKVKKQAEKAGIELAELGTVSGDNLFVEGQIKLSVKQLENAYESWFPDFMENK